MQQYYSFWRVSGCYISVITFKWCLWHGPYRWPYWLFSLQKVKQDWEHEKKAALTQISDGWLSRIHLDRWGLVIYRQYEATCTGERWKRNASSLHWWVRKAGVFHDESRKRALSERGQGGSVAGDADNLSQRGPLAALCPNLCRKWGETGRYVSPPLLLLLLGTRLLSHSVLPTLYALWSGSGILFPSLVFCYYFPFVYISFLAACETSEQWCG